MVRGGRRGCGRSQHPDGLRDWVAESRRRTSWARRWPPAQQRPSGPGRDFLGDAVGSDVTLSEKVPAPRGPAW